MKKNNFRRDLFSIFEVILGKCFRLLIGCRWYLNMGYWVWIYES